MIPSPSQLLSHRDRSALATLLEEASRRRRVTFPDIPPEALAFLEARTPRGSAWDTLLSLGLRGGLGLGVLASEGETLPGEVYAALCPTEGLGAPTPVALVFAGPYFDVLGPEEVAEHLAYAFAAHLLPLARDLALPTLRAQALMAAGIRPDPAWVSEVAALSAAGDWPALLQRFAGLDPWADPDGLLRGVLHGALGALLGGVPVGEIVAHGLARPYYRAVLEIPGLRRGWAGDRIVDGLTARLSEGGATGPLPGLFEAEVPERGRLLLPDLALDLGAWGFEAGEGRGEGALEALVAARVPEARARGEALIVGIVAPGGAGKTTLARGLCAALEARGLKAAYLGADAYLWPGEGFRYHQRGPHRETVIRGPGIYDDARLAADLDALRRGGSLLVPEDAKAGLAPRAVGPVDVVVCEGVFVGLDLRVRGQLDLLLSCGVDEGSQRPRFEAKRARDMGPGSVRRIDVPSDFAEKIFQESEDGILPLLRARGDGIYIRREGRLWRRGPGEPPQA